MSGPYKIVLFDDSCTIYLSTSTPGLHSRIKKLQLVLTLTNGLIL